MKLKGNIEDIQAVEQTIIDAGHCEVIHDGSTGVYSQFGSDGKSPAYSKVYLVHLDKRVISGQPIAPYLYRYFKSGEAEIRLWYDYRDNTADISAQNGVFDVVGKLIPTFEEIINKLRKEDNYVSNNR